MKLLNVFIICYHFRVAKQEIAALSQMAEQINSKFSSNSVTKHIEKPTKNGNDSVDLDNLFAFLTESNANGQNSHSKAIINELDDKMNNLIENLDEELENVIQQELDDLTKDKKRLSREISETIHENIINNNTTASNTDYVASTNPIPPKTRPIALNTDDQRKLIDTTPITIANQSQSQPQHLQQTLTKIGYIYNLYLNNEIVRHKANVLITLIIQFSFPSGTNDASSTSSELNATSFTRRYSIAKENCGRRTDL